MADTDNNTTELPSVFDMGGDVASQEAPPPLPARTYLAQITGAVAKTSPNSGNTYADIEFTIDPVQYPADYASVEPGPTKIHYRSMVLAPTPRNRYRWKQFGEKCRVTIGHNLDLNDFIGKTVNVKVKHRTWQGEQQAEIEAIEAA